MCSIRHYRSVVLRLNLSIVVHFLFDQKNEYNYLHEMCEYSAMLQELQLKEVWGFLKESVCIMNNLPTKSIKKYINNVKMMKLFWIFVVELWVPMALASVMSIYYCELS